MEVSVSRPSRAATRTLSMQSKFTSLVACSVALCACNPVSSKQDIQTSIETGQPTSPSSTAGSAQLVPITTSSIAKQTASTNSPPTGESDRTNWLSLMAKKLPRNTFSLKTVCETSYERRVGPHYDELLLRPNFCVWKFPPYGVSIECDNWDTSDPRSRGELATFGLYGFLQAVMLDTPTTTSKQLAEMLAKKIESQAKDEGGKVVSTTYASTILSGIKGTKLTQRVRFEGLPDGIFDQWIITANGLYYRLTIGALEQTRQHKNFKFVMQKMLSSFHVYKPIFPHRVSQFSDQQVAAFSEKALTSLKDYDGQFNEISIRYPLNLQDAGRPFYLDKYSDLRTVLTLRSDFMSIDLELCPVSPSTTLKSLADERIEHWYIVAPREFTDIAENAPCVVAGHPGHKLMVRVTPSDDMSKPVRRSTSYFTIVRDVSYELQISEEDDQYPQLQKLIDVILASYKIK